ncbi:MAG: hypothetical protein ED557_04280 [Balneola sp.]|nr:MAG: hypothetical protein ED557_04280 [Balneola sp.]
MESNEGILLELCKSKIEEKFHLGNGDARMKQRDFEYLIDLIEETSGIKLSISTLKRIWRQDEAQNPHPTTLNALVSILGYKDWLDFKLQNTPESSIGKPTGRKFNLSDKRVLVSLVAILVLSTASVIYFNKQSPEFYEGEVLFTANKTVSIGVPSTVNFDYDVSEIEADSFFIQQDWNPNHRDRINPESNFFSSIYYVPGYHKTKLVADETFLKIIPIHIQTDGWLSAAFYNYDERPVYITEDRNQDGILTAREEEILSTNLDIERFSELRFINIREYNGVDGHNFEAEARFRYREFLNDPCPTIQLTIHTEVHIYYVPLTLQGCESNLQIKIGEIVQSGRDYNLSVFGTDVYNWQELSIRVEEKAAKVLLNGSEVYSISFEGDFGNIVGLDFRTSGLSDIDYIRLRDLEGNLVFEDSF